LPGGNADPVRLCSTTLNLEFGTLPFKVEPQPRCTFRPRFLHPWTGWRYVRQFGRMAGVSWPPWVRGTDVGHCDRKGGASYDGLGFKSDVRRLDNAAASIAHFRARRTGERIAAVRLVAPFECDPLADARAVGEW